MTATSKARLWLLTGSALFILGLAARLTYSPSSVEYDVGGVLIGVGLVVFIQGFGKIRSLADADPEDHERPPE